MKTYTLLSFLLISTQIYAQCTLDECGPPPMMPNYLCSDGVTMAGPGDCIQNDDGQCYWEIIYCPSAYTGYLRSIDASFCMDACAYYYLESEDGGYISNITSLDNIESLSYFTDRYVYLDGEDVWCVECGAVDVEEIHISDGCSNPVDCFQDPCLVESCPAYPNSECVANYCDGCYADFYDINGNLIDCNAIAECFDLSGLFFGVCDMFLGYGVIDGVCEGVSGCGWDVDGVDYTDAFFDSIYACEEECGGGNMTCDEITVEYDSLHSGEYLTCDYDNDCVAVWGDCDVGLGGCHYSVNEENYPGDEIDGLVDMWLEGDCMQWVCDCSAEPYAQCIDGTCTSAYCMSDNPAGCFQTGCDDGYECIIDPNECVPSWCGCDGFYGEWYCTEDCGGGSCLAEGLLGDLNGDGQINVVDIVAAVNLILNGQYDAIGDMNGDGSLNVVDIIMVNQVLGLGTPQFKVNLSVNQIFGRGTIYCAPYYLE